MGRRRLALTEVRRALIAVLIARTALNGGLRVVYPFLPEIARGLGVSLAAIASLIGVRTLLAAVLSPIVARAAEQHGRRALMLSGVVCTLGGCLMLVGTDGLVLAATGLVLLGLAKPIFDIPMQGWFGDRVPYERSGRVFGTSELAWSLSLLVTVPLGGLLVAATSWQALFVLVGAYAAIGLVAIFRLIAPDRPAVRTRRPLRLTPARAAVLGVTFLFSLGAETVFVVYGAWLEDDLGLTVAAIGFFTLFIVAAELIGEGIVASLADRLGIRRTVFAGLAISALAYAALYLVGGSLAAAIIVVFVWFIAFEATMVSTVPLVSDLGAESRDRLLSFFIAAIAMGRAIGAVMAPVLYTMGGVGLNGLAAAACSLLALACLTRVPPIRNART